ncbi:uncharacterized protein LOC100906886 [Galendromus occidentalis]|uniref:Clathrin light chain n=1 Tax=Galendromus occidentalis TaxID=34638 RepID=A0AAJ6QUP6_9ACAR|nr:uncharacterized protein LOC100906886 [Galendromus occidentalis]
MSAFDNLDVEQAFPPIQDDPFGCSSNDRSPLDSQDCPGAKIIEDDPFSSFNVTAALKITNNPFLLDDVDEGCAPFTATLPQTETLSEGEHSIGIEEAPWPGNNTVDSTANISRDSASVDSSAASANTVPDSGGEVEFNGSSTSSGGTEPKTALDSDSGNLTVDVNESAQQENLVYGLMDSANDGALGSPAPSNVPIPTIMLTEPTIVSEKSSCLEDMHHSTSAGEGHSRLLESTEGETSHDSSHSNIASISTTDSTETTQAPTQAHDFFVSSESDHDRENGGIAGEDDIKCELVEAIPSEGSSTSSLSQPKQDRVFTSSPINPRIINVEEEVASDPLASWRREYQERIASKDEKEKKDIEDLRAQAKSDLDNWYSDRKSKIDAQQSLRPKDPEPPNPEEVKKESVWRRMSRLALDLQQTSKNGGKRRDLSRMKKLMQMLALKAPLPSQQP